MAWIRNIARDTESKQRKHLLKVMISFALAFALAVMPGLAFALEEGYQVDQQAAEQSVEQTAEQSTESSEPAATETLSTSSEDILADEDDPQSPVLDGALRDLEDKFKDYLAEENLTASELKKRTAYERALFVHDFLLGFGASFDPKGSYDYVEGIFDKRKDLTSKCFNDAFAHLLTSDLVGIGAGDVVAASSDGQVWTLVRLDNEWTHIDVAIDSAAGTSLDRICFGLTDEQIKYVHKNYVKDNSRQANSLLNNYYHRGDPRPSDGLSADWIASVKKSIADGIAANGNTDSFNIAVPVEGQGNIPSVGDISLIELVYSQIAAHITGQAFGLSGTKANVAYDPEIGDDGVYVVYAEMSLKNATVVGIVSERPYTGEPITQKPIVNATVNGGKITLSEGKDYVVRYERNTNPGIATVIIEGRGSFTGSQISTTFKIVPAKISETLNGNTSVYIDVTRMSSIMTYTGSPVTQDGIVVTYRPTKRILVQNDYTITYKNNVQPGYATLVITGRGNYTGSVEMRFKIEDTKGLLKPSSTPNNGTANNGTGSNGSSTVTTQSAPTAPTVTGTWKKSGGKWWFKLDAKSQASLKSSKNYPAGRWVTISKKRYYFDGSGYMKTGWLSYNNKWYYLGSDGAMKTGWQKSGGKWYYMASDGIMQTGKKSGIGGQTYYFNTSSGAMKTGWNKEGSTWYYYGSSGAMAKGWLKSGGKWYYLAGNGAMQTTKQTISGKTYNFNKSGVMITGWNKESGTYYHYGSSGAMSKGWVKSGGKWYFMDKSTGAMKTAWVDDGGSRYFMHPTNGDMLTGWNKITTTMSGKATSNFYYFSSSGVLQKNKWIGNYYVESDGKMATNKWIGKYHVNASGLWDATKK